MIILLINLICNPIKYSIDQILIIIVSGLFSGLGTILFSISIATGVAGISYTVANSMSIFQTLQDYIVYQKAPGMVAVVAYGLILVAAIMVF